MTYQSGRVRTRSLVIAGPTPTADDDHHASVPIYTASAHNLTARSQTGNKRCCYHQIKFDHCGKNWMDRRIQPSPMRSTYWINRNLPLWDLKQHLEVSSGKINLLILPLLQQNCLIQTDSLFLHFCLVICEFLRHAKYS